MPGIALSAEEREEIGLGLERTETFGDIARGLGRPTSTVSREVNRHGGRSAYSAIRAERRCHRQRRRPKLTVFEADSELAARVAGRLENKDSPMTISRREGVSHESVYQAIYAGGTRGLPAGLGRHLHRRRRRCRSRGAAVPRLSPLGAFKPIATRPPEAAEREEIGHFEGDLIIGQRGRSAVITLIDRATTFSMLGYLPYSHDATSVLERLDRIFTRLPEAGYRTLTWDQGSEMAAWEELEARHRIDVYFADPHSPPLSGQSAIASLRLGS
jgi:IS30 family transposase